MLGTCASPSTCCARCPRPSPRRRRSHSSSRRWGRCGSSTLSTLVVVDVSNNLALLSLLGRLLPIKRLVPVAITAGETSGAAPGMMPVITTDGRIRHLAKWSVARNALLGQLDTLGSTGAIVLPDPPQQPDVARLREQMRATSVEVTAAGRRRLMVPARVHDDVLMAVAMLAWAAPMALKHGLRQRATTGQKVPDLAWT